MEKNVKIKRKVWLPLVLALFCAVFFTAWSSCNTEEDPAEEKPGGIASEEGTEEDGFIKIEMKLAGGTVLLRLYPEIAPVTVENFVKLADKGFYDGLIFHRVIKDFMVQGGCPLGTGTGGPGYYIKGEFSANGFQNTLSHKRGVISMARSKAYDSAGSQFFIMHKDTPGLDGQYAAFGEVISGMELIDAIAETPTNKTNDRPLTEQKIVSIRVVRG